MLCTLKLLSSLQSKRIKTHDNTTSVQTQEKWSQNEATEGGSVSLAKSVWPSQSTTQGLILKSGGLSTLRPPGGDGETGGRVMGVRRTGSASCCSSTPELYKGSDLSSSTLNSRSATCRGQPQEALLSHHQPSGMNPGPRPAGTFRHTHTHTRGGAIRRCISMTVVGKIKKIFLESGKASTVVCRC